MKVKFNLVILLIILISCSKETDIEDSLVCVSVPTLLTQEVSDVTNTSAKFSGQIKPPTCVGTVTSQGFVLSKTTLPKTDDIVIEVAGENITSSVSNLEQNTKYYMRTFFENPTGEYYGNQVEFTTTIGQVKLSTKNVENITFTSARSGGIVIDDGGGRVINKGICWGTSPLPTIDDNKIENKSSSNDFNSTITGLEENKTYYIRAFATNETGTYYGGQKSFTTPISRYKVELKITGDTKSCNVQAKYYYFKVSYKFDDNNEVFDEAEGLDRKSHNYSKEGRIGNNLELTIHLGFFNPDNPSEEFKGAILDNISLVITNLENSNKVLNISLPSLFICKDSAYKNIINFNPKDKSYTLDRLTYKF